MIQALRGVSFHVDEGEIVALIGANGAGKTTILHTVSGLIRAESGEIRFGTESITKTPGHKLVGMGMAHVPEGRRVFADMTVYQNLKMGAFSRRDASETEALIKTVYERFPRLEERKTQLAGTLSGGEQQMLAISRALMSKPKLMLMDEPSMGLSPIFVNEIFDIIRQLHEEGTTI
ncbi:MAG: ABC transporter ATP-binding protein, partial [Lachnospiraceae bacterium]|nr:ABC transporter ATP-binding protein [Lachnospiraceae bacterium]